MKDLQVSLLVPIADNLENCPKEVLAEHYHQEVNIYSFTLMQRLIPSMIGLVLGLSSTIISSIVVATAVDAAAAIALAATVGWVPIVGWTLFGATAIASIAWITYSYFHQNQSETISYEYVPKPGYAIIGAFHNTTHFNGKLGEEFEKITGNKYSYKRTLKHNINEPRSAFASTTIIVYYTEENNNDLINGIKNYLRGHYIAK